MVKQYSKIAIFKIDEEIEAPFNTDGIIKKNLLKKLTFNPKYAIVVIAKYHNEGTSDVETYFFDDDNYHSIWDMSYDNYLKCKRIINGNEIYLETNARSGYDGFNLLRIVRIIAIG